MAAIERTHIGQRTNPTFCLKTVPLGDVSRSCNCATGPYLPSWATSFLGREGESVLFTEALDAVVIGLNAVSGIERRGRFAGHRLRVLGHLPEHMLESSGRDDLKDPARLVTGVPKCVPLVAGFEDEVSLLRVYDLIAEQRPHASLKDVAVLVLVRVTVKRGGECPRRDRMLDEREPASEVSLGRGSGKLVEHGAGDGGARA